MPDKITVPAEALEASARQLLEAAGMRSAHAALVARTLVFADLRGVSSHGVARLGSYLARVDAGIMAVDPDMPVLRDAPSAALLDAANGFGQLAGTKAIDLAIEKAREQGTGAVAVRNSNHFGVAAFFAERAAEAGMIGMVLTNASPAMTPYNTRTPLLGTNPIAFGIPAGDEKPIVLDMSTSLVARGKIRRASLTGETIPLGWAVDADGQPTQDPHAALKGSLAPVGGAKGAGLSLVIDLLCSVLTGTALTGEVRNITDLSGPSRTGHLFVAFDVERFAPLSVFQNQVAAVAAYIKSLPSADGGPVYLPGEIEMTLQARLRVEGIPVDRDVLDELEALRLKCGLATRGHV